MSSKNWSSKNCLFLKGYVSRGYATLTEARSRCDTVKNIIIEKGMNCTPHCSMAFEIFLEITKEDKENKE